jgi:hypothetical protein
MIFDVVFCCRCRTDFVLKQASGHFRTPGRTDAGILCRLMKFQALDNRGFTFLRPLTRASAEAAINHHGNQLSPWHITSHHITTRTHSDTHTRTCKKIQGIQPQRYHNQTRNNTVATATTSSNNDGHQVPHLSCAALNDS